MAFLQTQRRQRAGWALIAASAITFAAVGPVAATQGSLQAPQAESVPAGSLPGAADGAPDAPLPSTPDGAAPQGTLEPTGSAAGSPTASLAGTGEESNDEARQRQREDDQRRRLLMLLLMRSVTSLRPFGGFGSE